MENGFVKDGTSYTWSYSTGNLSPLLLIRGSGSQTGKFYFRHDLIQVGSGLLEVLVHRLVSSYLGLILLRLVQGY